MKWHITLAVALLACLALSHAGFTPLAPGLERLEFANLDLCFQVRGALPPEERIVIVAIDDASLQHVGAWPWPRARLAALVQRLAEARADLIVCDFILHEKPEDSLGTAQLVEAFANTRTPQSRSRVLLPYYFSEFQSSSPNLPPALPAPIAASALLLFDAPAALTRAPIPTASKLFHSAPALLAASQPGGHLNLMTEGETVRWEYQVIHYGEAYLPGLPLQVALLAQGLSRGEVRMKVGEEIQLGEITVPIDAQGRSLLNYYGARGTFPTLSATEILAGMNVARLAHKIVFVGVTAAGTQDFLRTPTSARMPGVEKLATATANILQQNTLVRPAYLRASELLLMLLLAPFAFALGRKWPVAHAVVFLFGIALVIWMAAFGFFASANFWCRPLGIILSTSLSGALGLAARSARNTAATKIDIAATRIEEMPRQLGSYTIVREIGEGAMGKIYEGNDPVLQRRVAIKTIRPLAGLSAAANARMRQRFLHEAQAAGALNHPNIVTIYLAEEAVPYSYLVMEYLEGRTLEEVITREAPLGLDKIVQLLTPICAALAYAHERGIVHRDVKPANLMLTREGVVKLMDFGIAHIFSSSLTQEGAMLGTPNYMAPEQIRGEKVDGRADIFAVAVVAYELATRQRPFGGDTLATISHHIVAGTFIPPSELNPKLTPTFDEVIRKALQKDRAERYADARALAAALAQLT